MLKSELLSRVAARKAELTAKDTLIARLQALTDMTCWAELASGAGIAAGDRVRYLLHTYECVQTHTKALVRAPANADYWTYIE